MNFAYCVAKNALLCLETAAVQPPGTRRSGDYAAAQEEDTKLLLFDHIISFPISLKFNQ